MNCKIFNLMDIDTHAVLEAANQMEFTFKPD
jgi:hypothetical protein